MGDDLLMLVTYRLVKEKYPNAKITVFSNHTENLKEFKRKPGYNKYIYKILGEEVTLIDWTFKGYFDLVVNGGGGIYFDDRKGPIYYYPFNTIIKWIGINSVYNIDSIIRKITGKSNRIKFGNRIGLGIGVGPFHPSASVFFRKVAELGSYDKLSVRDYYSFNLLKGLKFKQELFQNTDLSFLTELWIPQQTRKPIKKESDKIGIVLRGGTKEIHIHYKQLAEELRDKNFKVEFFAFDEYYDHDFINIMQPEFDVNIWNPNKMGFEHYLCNLWQCSVCITDRAHGAILGAIGNVIPLIIQSSEKSDQIVKILKIDTILDLNSYNKFYKLDDLIKVFNDQTNLRQKLILMVQKEIKFLNEKISGLISI